MNVRQINKKIITIILILTMLFTLAPTSMAFADATYGFQPGDKDGGGNSLKMINPSNVTLLQSTDDYYLNKINGDIDGTKEDGITFTFTMSAGMNNFQKDWFLEKSMPYIQIYDANEEHVVAEYSGGNGELKFLGSHQTGEGNNHGTSKTDELYIGVDKDVLGTGDYVILFGKNICGNNADKRLGKDIKFQFSVKAAPGLPNMILEAETFVKGITDNGLIDDTKPGSYPKADVETINNAIAAAKKQQGASPDEQAAAADVLYQALKVFKNSKNYKITGIDISGVHKTINVGDTGTAAAVVHVEPDEAQYKKVTWSAVTRPDLTDPSKDVPADNISINELTGKWIAAYSGSVWIKAVSAKSKEVVGYTQVKITAEAGVIAVNIPNSGTTLQELVEKTLAAGETIHSITSLKVFTTGSGKLTGTDIAYINKMPNVKTVDLQRANLETLEGSAFSEHKALTKIILPDTLKTIGSRAFYKCGSLKEIEIPASVTSIGGGAFAGCTGLNTKLIIHAVYPPTYSLTGSSGDSFDGTGSDKKASVTTIKVPYGCAADYKSKQGWRSFKIEESPQQKLSIAFTEPGTLEQEAETEMERLGITDSQVTDLKISSPAGVQMKRSEDVAQYLQTNFLYATTIDLSDTEFEDNKCNANVFKERISLKQIMLPETTQTIGGTCFYGCKNLRSMKLPEDLKNIGSGAFGECNMIGSSIVAGPSTPPIYDGAIFPDCVTTMIVPPGSEAEYRKASGWSSHKIISQIAIALSAKTLSMEVATTKTLTAKVTVYNNNSKDVMWSSSNTRVATVDQNGKVKGIKPGTAVITAKTLEGLVEAKCTVTVKAPAAPKAKAASAGYNKVKVTWTGISGASGYEIFRSTKKSGPYTKYTRSASTRSFTDTGKTTGTTYYYRVRAYKTSGKDRYAGSYSSYVSAKPTLSKPASVKAKSGGSKKIKVSWKKVSGASGYRIYRSTKKTKGYKSIKTVNSRTSKYTNSKLKKGKRYYYKVRAYRTVKGRKVYSAYSSIASYKAK